MCRSTNDQNHSRCAEESQFRIDAHRYRQVSTTRDKELEVHILNSDPEYFGERTKLASRRAPPTHPIAC